MNIKPIDIKDIPGKKNGYVETILNFISSGEKAAEIDFFWGDAYSAYRALMNNIRRKGLQDSVKVAIRQGRIFLIRKDISNE